MAAPAEVWARPLDATGRADADDPRQLAPKHPTPAATGGEFHWYPATEDDRERDLRANLVERTRGIDPPAVLWDLASGRVVWAQPFAAVAPTDRRRYLGLAVTVIEQAGAAAADLLERVEVPIAGPCSGEREVVRRAPGVVARTTSSVEDELSLVDVLGIARALLAGGIARIGDPASSLLPRAVASVERLLPALGLRRGSFLAGVHVPGFDLPAQLVAAAWAGPTSRGAAAWRLMRELATARETSVDEVAIALAAAEADPLCALASDERGESDFVAALHAWGRGRLDRTAGADTLVVRLADTIALRALAALAQHRDPVPAIAEVRWHALLPAARRRRCRPDRARAPSRPARRVADPGSVQLPRSVTVCTQGRGWPPSDPQVLDDVSDHLGEVLRRADALLVEWTKFGAQVQIQVDREARAIGDTVAASVEDAVTRATLTSVDRALGDQIAARIASLTAELARLEQRTRAAATGVQRERSTDRRLLWAVLAGIVGANVLLAVVLRRRQRRSSRQRPSRCASRSRP